MIGASELEGQVELNNLPPIDNLTFIDSGADSSVYRYGNYAIKVYKPRPNLLEGVQLYQQITNQAAALMEEHPQILQVQIGDSFINYTVSVNPIIFAGQDPNNPDQIISVSRFVSGPQLLGNYPSEIPFDSRAFADPVSSQLEDLSDQLNEKFGVKGILIKEPNVKMNYDPTKQVPISLTVTDLSAHVWAFTPTQK